MAESRDLTTFLVILFALLLIANSTPTETIMTSAKGRSLVARLKLNENSCWDSLFELQSCTGEVILFFLNGETQLGHECCKAVQLIEEYCWPNVIASLGFTSQEEQVLRGYCDKENASGRVH